MKQVLSSITLVIFLLIAGISYGQSNSDQGEGSLENGTIEDKIDYLIKESSNYRNYEVIQRKSLKDLQSMISDTINQLNNKLDASEKRLNRQADSLKLLQNEVVSLTDSLNTTLKSGDTISFFGSRMNKGLYKTIVWLVVIALILSVIYVIYRGKANRYLLERTKSNQEKLQKEFDSYKKRALEREQKLKRELMDERNQRL